MGLLVIIGMIIYPKKWAQTIPSSLMAIILATVAMFLFHLPIATVGKIPQTLISSDRLTFAAFHLDSLKEVMVPAISIACLAWWKVCSVVLLRDEWQTNHWTATKNLLRKESEI